MTANNLEQYSNVNIAAETVVNALSTITIFSSIGNVSCICYSIYIMFEYNELHGKSHTCLRDKV